MYLDQYGMVQFGNGGGGGGGSSAKGRKITALTASSGVVTVPADEKSVYTYTVASGDTIGVESPAQDTMPVSWLLLTIPSVAPAFSFATGIIWPNSAGIFASTNPAPTFTGNYEYLLTFVKDGNDTLCNVAYSKAL